MIIIIIYNVTGDAANTDTFTATTAVNAPTDSLELIMFAHINNNNNYLLQVEMSHVTYYFYLERND